MNYESTLAKITQEVYNAKTAQEAKHAMVVYLQGTKVKDRDRMITAVQGMNNLTKIQVYFSNCLLKFEGLGTSNYTNKKKEDEVHQSPE